MRAYFIYVLIIINSCFVYSDTVINEVMYNPESHDNNKEFIEIYSDEWINLSGYIIEDSSSSDVLEPLQYSNNNFYLIVEEGFDYSGLNVSVYSVGATIGNNLNNDMDLIIIKDNNSNVLDVMSYSSEWGADGNNKSLCRFPDRTGLWKECSISPGRENSLTGIDYSFLEINEFMPNPQGNDDASMPNGEWVEIYNNGDNEINLEGFTINDDYGNGLVISNVNFLENSAIIGAKDYLVLYRNGDGKLQLNNQGLDSVRLYGSDGNLIDEVSYGNSQEGASWAKINGMWLLSLPSPDSLNVDVKKFDKSWLKIERIYLGNDDKAKFGDELRAKITVYKGNSTKESVKMWVEEDNIEISKKSSINVHDRFRNYSLTFSVRLNSNCNNKYKDGEYKLILNGLDKFDSETFKVEGITESLCETVVKESRRSIDDVIIEFLELPEEVDMNEKAIVKLKITNNASDDEKVKVWSYIYRGPKSYSGERKANLQEINLPRNSAVVVELKNDIEEHVESGDYKLKVRIQKEDRKTSDDFTSSVKLMSTPSEKEGVENVEEKSLTAGNVVYESSDIKARGYGVYFLIGLLIVLVIFLSFKKGL